MLRALLLAESREQIQAPVAKQLKFSADASGLPFSALLKSALYKFLIQIIDFTISRIKILGF